MSFELRFSQSFKDDVLSLSNPNPKFKQMLEKALPLIKNNPYYKAEFIEQAGYWRRHIIAEKYRILYDIDENKKIVILQRIKLKNKSTYK